MTKKGHLRTIDSGGGVRSFSVENMSLNELGVGRETGKLLHTSMGEGWMVRIHKDMIG
jgi:hypothetical protein